MLNTGIKLLTSWRCTVLEALFDTTAHGDVPAEGKVTWIGGTSRMRGSTQWMVAAYADRAAGRRALASLIEWRRPGWAGH